MNTHIDIRSATLGKNAESAFVSVLIKHNIPFVPATRWQQKEHWDYLICPEKYPTKIEVKSAKRINRWDDDVCYSRIVIELHGAQTYNSGWLHGGADFLAFEQQDDFLFVRREKLLNWVLSLDLPKKVLISDERGDYQPYFRPDRDYESFFYMPLADLISNIFSTILTK